MFSEKKWHLSLIQICVWSYRWKTQPAVTACYLMLRIYKIDLRFKVIQCLLHAARGRERERESRPEWGSSALTSITVSKAHKKQRAVRSLTEEGVREVCSSHTEALLTHPPHLPFPLLLFATVACPRRAAHPIGCLSGPRDAGPEVSVFSDRWLLGDGCWYELLDVEEGPAAMHVGVCVCVMLWGLGMGAVWMIVVLNASVFLDVQLCWFPPKITSRLNMHSWTCIN